MKILFRQPVIPRDIPVLYELMSKKDQYLFSTHLHWNTIQQFESWLLKASFTDFYLLEYQNRVIGFAFAYDLNLLAGHCKITLYICEQYRNLGLGGFAGIQYLEILFSTYPLRKIYSTIYEYNQQSLESNLKAGFVQEGVIPNYRYYKQHYYDLYILSISREKYSTLYKRKEECS